MAALRAPGGRMQGAAAQAMSVHIVEPPQPEGRMGLAGDRGVAPPRRSTPGSPSSSRLALASQYPCARPFVLSPRAARAGAAGSLDLNFNGTGKVLTELSGLGLVDEALAVAVQPDGKIVVAGRSSVDGIRFTLVALARYNA